MKLYSGPLSLFTAKVRVASTRRGRYENLGAVLASERVQAEFRRGARDQSQAGAGWGGDEASRSKNRPSSSSTSRPLPWKHLYPRDVRERARCRQLAAADDEIFFPGLS